MGRIKSFYKFLIFGISLLVQCLLMIWFYSPYERFHIYWTIVVAMVIMNLLLLVLIIYEHIHKLNKSNFRLSILLVITLLITTLTYSYFQFTYVIVPFAFFKSEVFYYQYKYSDLKDDVRVEYFARNFQGKEEIFRYSYDKDEIKTFLSFFKDTELLPDNAFEGLNNPNVFVDWKEDIHVMIRNMEDENIGYYVFHVDIVDTSDYVKSFSDGTTTYIYKLPDGLREFATKNLTK